MTRITVTDLPTSLENHHKFDFVIGMLDPSEKFQVEKVLVSEGLEKNRFMFWFQDILEGRGAPQEHHVEAILKAFNDHSMKDTHINVHCYAGISRSTATAIGLLINDGKTIKDAYTIVKAQRRQLWPNQTILKHFDKILNLNGELVKFDQQWKKDEVENGCIIY